MLPLQVLTAYCNMLHILRPEKAPGFAYAWLEIVSHRFFMDKILNNYSQKGWPVYATLLVDLFKFLSSFLRNAELARPVNRLVFVVIFLSNTNERCSFRFDQVCKRLTRY